MFYHDAPATRDMATTCMLPLTPIDGQLTTAHHCPRALSQGLFILPGDVPSPHQALATALVTAAQNMRLRTLAPGQIKAVGEQGTAS